ncbi:helix-turn-helix domain-containing protein [Rhabdothermincola sediminis]|uniref:helix-turn-helix domain-containing protein n=1 Tax=Rhabdothermincola sediminis TaxID=2751370 RepID=UPI001AA02B14|nr:helix-turn-helix domain-containing protein [Rhabdothermincola sediminis]
MESHSNDRPAGARLLAGARRRAGLSQRELAVRAGTSRGTLAEYETGKRDPRLSTALRLLRECGASLVEEGSAPASTPDTRQAARDRHEARSIALHAAILDELRREPATVLRRARATLDHFRAAHPDGSVSRRLDEWELIVGLPVEIIADVLVSPTPHARELRQTSPFAGVLPAKQRWDLYRRFRRDGRRAS